MNVSFLISINRFLSDWRIANGNIRILRNSSSQFSANWRLQQHSWNGQLANTQQLELRRQQRGCCGCRCGRSRRRRSRRFFLFIFRFAAHQQQRSNWWRWRARRFFFISRRWRLGW